LHEVLNWGLWASVALHVAGAMKHQVVDKDPTLSRMTKGVPAGTTETTKTSHAFSATLALGVWAVMLSAGAAMGMFEEREPRPTDAAELAEVDSQWTVQDGTLAITIQQMGSAVEGTFEQWTADIAFEEQDAPGKTGEVTVEIATGSIALGSVTSQAVGSDFLAVETFPTAVFQADILNVADGYAAEGTLTLKGVTMPVTMPFQMTIQDGIATMEGRTTLERLNYGVGENMADGTQLGLRVDVSVKLVAEKAD
jgi:polyisoprenoid-binding protein YceI